MSFIVKRGEYYSARLVIPVKLRSILGRNEFKKSLGTTSRKEAALLAAPLVLNWKQLIQQAKTDGITSRAKALRRDLAAVDDDDIIDDDEASAIAASIIIEAEIEEHILGGRAIESITSKRQRDAAKAFYDIASGQVKLLDDHVDGWLASIVHLKLRTINQRNRDVTAFLKEETAKIPTRESVAAWIRASYAQGDKSVKRKLESLGSFWEYLLVEGVVTGLSPFSSHKLPKAKKRNTPKRRCFTNEECLAILKAARGANDQPLLDTITLALHTGARIEELCKLRVEDVVIEDNLRCLRINKSKTDAGSRIIPLHPAIADLIDRLCRDTKDGYLIPSTSINQYNERSTGLGRRFGRLKTSLGYGPELVFHSLRKTVTTKLEQAGVPEGVAADIVGHKKQTMTYGLYSGGSSMTQKMDAIIKITY